jgi:hypothetical protein
MYCRYPFCKHIKLSRSCVHKMCQSHCVKSGGCSSVGHQGMPESLQATLKSELFQESDGIPSQKSELFLESDDAPSLVRNGIHLSVIPAVSSSITPSLTTNSDSSSMSLSPCKQDINAVHARQLQRRFLLL